MTDEKDEPLRVPPWTPESVEEVRRTATPKAFSEWHRRHLAQCERRDRVPDGCAPGAYRLYREYFVANFMDGDDGGMITVEASALADEVAEMFSCEHWRETWNGALIAEMRGGDDRLAP